MADKHSERTPALLEKQSKNLILRIPEDNLLPTQSCGQWRVMSRNVCKYPILYKKQKYFICPYGHCPGTRNEDN